MSKNVDKADKNVTQLNFISNTSLVPGTKDVAHQKKTFKDPIDCSSGIGKILRVGCLFFLFLSEWSVHLLWRICCNEP